MAYQLSDIKVSVANQLGATNGTDSVPKRDRAINDARREYYGAYKWSFCFKSESISITSQEGSLPATYNKKFDPEAIYSYSGNNKYDFTKVAWDDVDNYTTGSYVYAINKQTGKIKINQTTFSTVTLDYYQMPTDAPIDTTEDSTDELAPDITAIVYNSIARWWLTAERNGAMFDRFMDMYRDQLLQDKKIDASNRPVKNVRWNRLRQGYNRGMPTKANTGYSGSI